MVTGIALIMLLGMKAVGPAIHIAMVTGLALFIVNIVGTQKALQKVSDALANEPASAENYMGKVGMFAGIQHALWAITLALMVFRHAV